jgi:ubiquitin carboxyl-terminal hydrolase 22/27/51
MYNLGATCFMSVILQSFLHNPLLRNFYLSDGHRTGTCMQEDCINCGMDELFQDFYAQDTTSAYGASNLLSISWQIQNKTYPKLLGDDENDAHEYFQFLTEALHASARSSFPSLSKSRDVSEETVMDEPCNCIVHQTFYGSLQSSTTCQDCGAVTTSNQPFLDLNLGLASIVRKRAGKGGKGGQRQANMLTLQKCLDTEYIQPELCDYNCHSCKSLERKGKRVSTIKRLPNVLCIQFKVSCAHLHSFVPHTCISDADIVHQAFRTFKGSENKLEDHHKGTIPPTVQYASIYHEGEIPRHARQLRTRKILYLRLTKRRRPPGLDQHR